MLPLQWGKALGSAEFDLPGFKPGHDRDGLLRGSTRQIENQRQRFLVATSWEIDCQHAEISDCARIAAGVAHQKRDGETVFDGTPVILSCPAFWNTDHQAFGTRLYIMRRIAAQSRWRSRLALPYSRR